jgi:hypothetical protein
MRKFVRYGIKVTGKNQVIAGVFNEETNTLSVGISSCHNNDCYVKAIGKNIALGRAEKAPNTIISLTDPNVAGRVFREYAERLFKDNKKKSCLSKWDF